MILILSVVGDLSASKVINWLHYHNKCFFRINSNGYNSCTLNIKIGTKTSDILLTTDSSSFNFSSVTFFWNRYNQFPIQANEELVKIANHSTVEEQSLFNYLNGERQALNDFLIYKLNQLPKLGCGKDLNKLAVLDQAKSIGFSIPETEIININKIVNPDRFITKGIQRLYHYQTAKFKILSYTDTVDLYERKDAQIFPSLIQRKIDSKYELRIFFLYENLFCVAQIPRKGGEIDIRNNNNVRMQPFKLPSHVAAKIQLLRVAFDLDFGSIDMLVTKENNFIFLELNSNGQYDFISGQCNLYLEKLIAECIIKKSF